MLSLILYVCLSVAEPGFPKDGAKMASFLPKTAWNFKIWREATFFAPLNPPLFMIHVSRFGVVLFQSAMTAVKVKSPTCGWFPVPFTMFPFSNIARNLVPFEASNVKVLLPLSISPLPILKESCTFPKISNEMLRWESDGKSFISPLNTH